MLFLFGFFGSVAKMGYFRLVHVCAVSVSDDRRFHETLKVKSIDIVRNFGE